MPREHLIRPAPLPRLTGQESFGDETLGCAKVIDFWRWALGDLRMNNVRGYLVEFLVARALGDQGPVRVEWRDFDVEARDGTRVEVKAAGRLQSWTLHKLSMPTWSFKSVRADRVWCEERAQFVAVDPATRVDVWVFALQTAEDPAAYDPLDIEQWEFRVVPHRRLLCTRQTTAGTSFFDRLRIRPVKYAALADAVTAAHGANERLAIRSCRCK